MIWHLCLEISANVKNCLRLSHLQGNRRCTKIRIIFSRFDFQPIVPSIAATTPTVMKMNCTVHHYRQPTALEKNCTLPSIFNMGTHQGPTYVFHRVRRMHSAPDLGMVLLHIVHTELQKLYNKADMVSVEGFSFWVSHI